MDKRSSLLKFALLPIVVLSLLCLISANAHAANDRLSSEYLAGFAFFKFAKAQPDFKDWVFRSEAYAKATVQQRTVMLRSETQKLENSFAIYEADRNPITVKTRITFMMPTANAAHRMIKENGKVEIQIRMIDYPDKFFPLQVADMWIALIPEDIDDFLMLALSEEEFTAFRQQNEELGIAGRAEAVLSLTLLPTTADTKKPLSIKGFDLWMLMADVISLEIWSKDAKKMAWYMDIPGNEQAKRNSSIDGLYKN